MSHGTDVVEGRSADVTHLVIHGEVNVKSNSKNFDLILEYSTRVQHNVAIVRRQNL